MKQEVDGQSAKLAAKHATQPSTPNIPGLAGLKDMKTSKLFQKFMQQQNPDEKQPSFDNSRPGLPNRNDNAEQASFSQGA